MPADPFDWRSGSAEAVCAQLKLRHGGTVDVEGRRCHVVESRPGGDEPSRQWWIDADSHLLVRVVSHDDAGRRTTTRPAFAHVNEPLPHMEAIPNASYQAVSGHKRMAEPLPRSVHADQPAPAAHPRPPGPLRPARTKIRRPLA